MRIAVSGSAGVGKTTLAMELARRLKLPYISEEMRDYLEAARRPLQECAPQDIARALADLWSKRTEREEALGSFVADNSSLDFIAYARYYGCQDHPSVSRLLREAPMRLRAYDACLLLPFGAIPYIADGIRPSCQESQSRYQEILEELYVQHAGATRIHALPSHCSAREERLRWAMSALTQSCPASAIANK